MKPLAFDIARSAFDQLHWEDQELRIIRTVAETADELQLETYLVGGYVRDKILDRKVVDMDFVCVGDGIILAEKVAQKLKGKPEVSIFKNFGTAHIRFGKLDLEFVGARKESTSITVANRMSNPVPYRTISCAAISPSTLWPLR